MSVVARSLRRFSRAKSTVPSGDVLSRVFDRWANLFAVRDHGKGAPSYREGESAEVFGAVVDTTAALADPPNTTAPAAGTGLFDLSPFGALCLYWRPTAAAELVLAGTADSGGADTIVLANDASDVDNAYNGLWIAIVAGTGAGQRALILDYDGGTLEVTIDGAWDTQPDNTSEYEIRASFPASHANIDVSIWAQADTGDWLRINHTDSLEPFVELQVPGTGYRQVFVQVTDYAGGLTGQLDVLVAGD